MNSVDNLTRQYLEKILSDYVKETKSVNAINILENISKFINRFKLVKPINSSLEDIKNNTINKVA